jgi:hypothetical protein
MENSRQDLEQYAAEKNNSQTINKPDLSIDLDASSPTDLLANQAFQEQVRESSCWIHLMKASLGTAVFFIAVVLGSWTFASFKADCWGQNLRYYSELDSGSEQTTTKKLEANLNTYLQEFPNSTSSEKARIKEQLERIRLRAKAHLYSTKDLYIWSSVTVAVASLASVVTALCLLHITRRGWDNTNSFVSGIFVISLGTLALSSSFVVIYQYDRNIKTNANLYISYINLEEEVITALATKLPIGEQPSTQNQEKGQIIIQSNGLIKLRELIQKTNKILKEYNTLSLEFDLNNLPSADEILKKAEISK